MPLRPSIMKTATLADSLASCNKETTTMNASIASYEKRLVKRARKSVAFDLTTVRSYPITLESRRNEAAHLTLGWKPLKTEVFTVQQFDLMKYSSSHQKLYPLCAAERAELFLRSLKNGTGYAITPRKSRPRRQKSNAEKIYSKVKGVAKQLITPAAA